MEPDQPTLLQPPVPQTSLGTAAPQHPVGPLPSPGVPSPTSHALQCSLQLADPPVELRAELEADQAMSDPTNTGPQATHWAC